MKKCSYCLTSNDDDAVICRTCGRDLAKTPVTQVESKAPSGLVGLIKGIAVLAWLGTIAGVGVGCLILFTGLGAATGAPQEAVVICLSLACAILPYCIARAFTEIYKITVG